MSLQYYRGIRIPPSTSLFQSPTQENLPLSFFWQNPDPYRNKIYIYDDAYINLLWNGFRNHQNIVKGRLKKTEAGLPWTTSGQHLPVHYRSAQHFPDPQVNIISVVRYSQVSAYSSTTGTLVSFSIRSFFLAFSICLCVFGFSTRGGTSIRSATR